jgi:hypothetical protein
MTSPTKRKGLCWDVEKLLQQRYKWNIIMNNTSLFKSADGYARDWWYDVYPNLMFYAVADFYQMKKDYTDIQRSVDKFYKADSTMAGNYHHSFLIIQH